MKQGLQDLATRYASMIDTRKGKPDIDDETDTGDGYWVYLAPGFIFDNDTHIVHEYTIADLNKSMARVAPCTCEQCQTDLWLRYNNGESGFMLYEPLPEKINDSNMCAMINRALYLGLFAGFAKRRQYQLSVADLATVNVALDAGLSGSQAYDRVMQVYQF